MARAAARLPVLVDRHSSDDYKNEAPPPTAPRHLPAVFRCSASCHRPLTVAGMATPSRWAFSTVGAASRFAGVNCLFAKKKHVREGRAFDTQLLSLRREGQFVQID